MEKKIIRYSQSSTFLYLDASFKAINTLIPPGDSFFLTDENIYNAHTAKFKGRQAIVIKPGEAFKTQETVAHVVEQLISLGASRKSWLVGVGGGVVTDIAGYVAGIYMRGIKFAFVPTSILAMVDAAIGGKNGVDVGVYKNMVGLIRQPSFLLYDYSLLRSLPAEEWMNGCAEIIKHACIRDEAMFKLLEQHKLADFQKDKLLLSKLIQRNALLKSKIVQGDEFEEGERKLLNFGHTLGHAIENTHHLPHGHAVAVGMVAAAYLSREVTGFQSPERVVALIQKYGLPAFHQFDAKETLALMMSDKKRVKNEIHYVLLERIGKAVIKPLTIKQIATVIEELSK